VTKETILFAASGKIQMTVKMNYL